MTDLALNDSSIWIINRDIALFLGVLTLLAAVFRLQPRLVPKWAGVKQFCEFLKDSWWEVALVFILRAFFLELYMIPSSSMQPTVYPGDVILVSKYPYGFKWPGLNTTFLDVGKPQAGETVVFLDPKAPTVRKMIKRVIGCPGDHVSITGSQIVINGMPLSTKYLYQDVDYIEQNGKSYRLDVQYFEQEIGTHNPVIAQMPQMISTTGDLDFTVPADHYFVMGDNRSNSQDSRYMGFVPSRFICGRAEYVVMSFGTRNGHYDFSRIGRIG
ncbi:MAG: signal peptidase I [Gammaproteobacteria bacterium]|nr:signal peptidase I [Gammaproteobacteria bacterium]